MNNLGNSKNEVQRYSIFSNAGRLIYASKGRCLKDVLKQALDKGWCLVNCHIDNEDLSGLDFSGVDLSYSDFYRCDFKDCLFDRTYLNHTNFNQCMFRGSSIIESIYDTASFKDCEI